MSADELTYRYGYCFLGGNVSVPCTNEQASNFFTRAESRLYDRVEVSSKIRLFPGPWAAAFVHRCMALAKPAGLVRIPVAAPTAKVGLPVAFLTELVDAASVTISGETAEIRVPATLGPPPASILSWYLAHHAELIMIEREGAASPPAARDPLADAFPGTAKIASRPSFGSNPPNGSMSPPRSISDIAKSHSYLIQGISYKAPILAYILRQQRIADRQLDIVDIGGGFGALAAELCLTRHLTIRSALTLDIAPKNVHFARSLALAYDEELGGYFTLSVGRAETAMFAGPFHLVTFIGSLLYIPRNQTVALLDQLWDKLTKGGLLVVHENIKAPAFVRDYDRMFDVPELMALLGRYGPVSGYASTYLGEIDLTKAGDKTIFRVVQKP